MYLTVSFPGASCPTYVRLTVSITDYETIWSLKRGQLNVPRPLQPSVTLSIHQIVRLVINTKELVHGKMINSVVDRISADTLMRHKDIGVHLSERRIWILDREKFSSLARRWIDWVANSIVSLTRTLREIGNESRQRVGRYYVALRLSFGTKRYYAELNIMNWNIIIITYTYMPIVLSFGTKYHGTWKRESRRNINRLRIRKYLTTYCNIITIF